MGLRLRKSNIQDFKPSGAPAKLAVVGVGTGRPARAASGCRCPASPAPGTDGQCGRSTPQGDHARQYCLVKPKIASDIADISRSAMLAGAHCFGFDNSEAAARYLDTLLTRVTTGYFQTVHWLEPAWEEMLRARMQ